jgi:hypothetical protein
MKKPSGSVISCVYHRLARSLAHPLPPQTSHSTLLVARILTAFLRLGFRYLPFGRRQASWLTGMAFAVSRTATNARCLSLQGPFSRSLSAWPEPTQYIDTMVRAHSDVTIDGQSVCQSVLVSCGLCPEIVSGSAVSDDSADLSVVINRLYLWTVHICIIHLLLHCLYTFSVLQPVHNKQFTNGENCPYG